MHQVPDIFYPSRQICKQKQYSSIGRHVENDMVFRDVKQNCAVNQSTMLVVVVVAAAAAAAAAAGGGGGGGVVVVVVVVVVKVAVVRMHRKHDAHRYDATHDNEYQEQSLIRVEGDPDHRRDVPVIERSHHKARITSPQLN